ncbi:MAG: DDE-type integrase/transposase/recombinase [Candidatus Contendobacter sp.]|nr:DDE-type integrase/transposase/recombinase [Candidatus Contendobacter sp.]
MPDLPRTDRRIRARADSEGWRSRPREFGKGIEYHLSALPLAVQEALLRAEAREVLAETPAPPPAPVLELEDPEVARARKAEGDAAAALLAGKARARVEAKREIVAVLLAAKRAEDKADFGTLVGRYNDGILAVSDETRALEPRISLPSFYRWVKQLDRYGLSRLAGRYGNRAGCSIVDRQPQLAAALRGLLVEHPHAKATFTTEWLRARYAALPAEIAGDGPLDLPGVTAVRRWMKRWKRDHAELYTRLRNPDDWKSRYMLGWGDASAGISRLNQVWEFDSTPADVLLKDGRHSILGVIDVYSRRVRLHVSKTSKAAAVASLLRGCLRDWGVPEIAKTDNGQEYVSHHVSRIFQALGIEQQCSAPFSPWQKPFVERSFRTFSHDLMEYLPGYAGHDVAEREQLRARAAFADRLFTKNAVVALNLTAADLQKFCDRWCAAYHVRAHSALGCTPLERVANWRQPLRMVSNERVLDLLLMDAPGDGWRTVSKSSGVRLDAFDFLAPELALYVNQRIRVLYDPEGDAGRVWCFDDQGGFIALAECPELTGVDRKAIAAHAKALQHQHIQAAVQEARAEAKQINVKTALTEVMDARDAAANKLLHFPNPVSAHDTPAIAGAQAALDAQTPRPAEVVPAEKLNELRKKMAREDADRARRADRPDFATPYARAHWIYERVLRGKIAVGEVSAEDRDWLRGYVRTEAASSRNLERVLRDFFPRFDEVKATLLREEKEESADAGQQTG